MSVEKCTKALDELLGNLLWTLHWWQGNLDGYGGVLCVLLKKLISREEGRGRGGVLVVRHLDIIVTILGHLTIVRGWLRWLGREIANSVLEPTIFHISLVEAPSIS